jgi:hypothetical protein
VIDPKKLPVDSRSGSVLDGYINVTGTDPTGVYPTTLTVHVQLTLNGDSAYTVSSTNIDFGNLVTGAASSPPSQVIHITNTGANPFYFARGCFNQTWLTSDLADYNGGAGPSVLVVPGQVYDMALQIEQDSMAPGDYTAQFVLGAFDPALENKNILVSAHVQDQCPPNGIRNLSLYAPVTVVKVNTPVSFFGHWVCQTGSSDSLVAYWNFGDVGPVTGKYGQATHSYSQPGYYRVVVLLDTYGQYVDPSSWPEVYILVTP